MSDDDVEMVPDSEGVMDEEQLPAANKGDSMRAIEGGRRHEDGGTDVHSGTNAVNEPMKTMAELAAEHAKREHQLGQGSTRGSKRSRRTAGSSRAQRKPAIHESEDEPDMDEDEDPSEPSLTDDPSDPSPPRRHRDRATSSKAPARTNPRSLSKSTPNPRNKRPRSPDIGEGSGIEYDGSSRSKAMSTGRRPRRTITTGAGKIEPRATRAALGSSAISVVVPVSDRVLRSRKVRV